jgi:hypothetical protein
MGLTVKERGQNVATFRYVQVFLMETLAAWVPTTPEMEVKLLFGEHIWDFAQHADALGRRTYELRLPLQHSAAPTDDYERVLRRLASTEETTRRIAGIYDAMLPALERRYRRYLDATDTLMDAPTVRILERILVDGARMMDQSRQLREELPHLRLGDSAWTRDLTGAEADAGEMAAPALEAVTPAAT